MKNLDCTKLPSVRLDPSLKVLVSFNDLIDWIELFLDDLEIILLWI